MADREKVISGLKHCFGDDCGVDGWNRCEYSGHGCTDALLEDALALLKAQEPEPTKFQIKTTISNVDIPKDIDEEQFMVVLSQQYAALARLYGDDVPTYNPS